MNGWMDGSGVPIKGIVPPKIKPFLFVFVQVQ